VTVDGAPVLEPISFSAAPPPSGSHAAAPSEFLGLPLTEGYAVVGAIILVGILAVVAILWSRRRGPPPPEGAAAPPTPGTVGPPTPPK
jgi:hypothetical protein